MNLLMLLLVLLLLLWLAVVWCLSKNRIEFLNEPLILLPASELQPDSTKLIIKWLQ